MSKLKVIEGLASESPRESHGLGVQDLGFGSLVVPAGAMGVISRITEA